MSIAENLRKIKSELPDHVTLVAVSKTKPASDIQEAYDSGQRDFGENRAQEMQEKANNLPKDIRWHMIGHLQRNKVKYIVDSVHLVHGVDSYKLLREINKEGKKVDRIIPCLLQFHIAKESSKFGLDLSEAEAMLQDDDFQSLDNIKIRGVMGMATFTNEMEHVRSEFNSLKEIFDQLKAKFFADSGEFKTISMGMSGDYGVAIGEGSNMVRVGSAIFGARD